MKHHFFTFVLCLVAVIAAHPGSGSEWPIITSETSSVIDARIGKMLCRVSRQKESYTDREFLHSIFKKTQKEFLHRYTQYADLDELAHGSFDCLTATTLFAVILTRSGYDFRIIETNYHIFLLVSTEEGQVLIETTDRFDGFVTAKEDIAKKMEEYRTQVAQAPVSYTPYQYDFQVFGEIDSTQLAGLLYFNQAVKAYNEGRWIDCSKKIRMAANHHNSPRVGALAAVLICATSVAGIEEAERELIQSNLSQFDQSGWPTAGRK
jgi:hypothetical protein